MSARAHSRRPSADPGPWWRDALFWRRAALTYALGAAGGAAAVQIHVPLPWMLGPFFVCAAVSVSGFVLAPLPFGRETGQLVVGLTIGLRFTAATLLTTLSLLPAMLAATLYVVLYTILSAFLFRPLAGVGRVTAFFATAAGGVADMAIVARQRGGDASSVAVVHALRVSSTVAIIPILVVSFGTPGNSLAAAATSGQGMIGLVPAIAVSVLAAQLLKRTSLPNPWLVGPMFVGIALGASGALTLAVPALLIIIAQILLGTWLGCRFRREVLVKLPRVALAGFAASLFMIAAAFAGALALAAFTGLGVSTAFLALAPAAVTEMVITAKAMHLDAEIVSAFHVMRIFLVCSTVLLVYRLYSRIAGTGSTPRDQA